MSTKNKFRGILLSSNEWIEGYFFKTEVGIFIGEYNDEQIVKPNTTSQFTGVSDAWEFDIYQTPSGIFVVNYSETHGAFVSDWIMHKDTTVLDLRTLFTIGDALRNENCTKIGDVFHQVKIRAYCQKKWTNEMGYNWKPGETITITHINYAHRSCTVHTNNDGQQFEITFKNMINFQLQP